MSRFGGRLRGTTAVSQWLTGGVAAVKSVQRGTITIAPAATSNTATVAAVSPANSRLVYLGNSSTEDGGTSVASTGVRLVLTNATTITASRLAATGTVIVSYELTEYHPGAIKSVQRGTVTATAALTGTATINAVTSTAKTTIDLLGWDYNSGLFMDQLLGRVDLTNTTTVTLTRTDANGNLTAGFQVTEWN